MDQEAELQQMLARKRQQPQPSPRFFKDLSSAVIDRIQNPEPPPPRTLLQKLGLDFDSKPLLVCISGVVVCGLLAYALISSRDVKEPPAAPEVDPSQAVQSTPIPGQLDSMPPVKPPGAKSLETPRNGQPPGVNPARPDSMDVRPWPKDPAPPAGK